MKRGYVVYYQKGSKKLFVNKRGNLGSFAKCELFETKREAKEFKRRDEKIALVITDFVRTLN